MNEELIKLMESLKGFDEVGIFQLKTRKLLVKFVYSEIVEVQRLVNTELNVIVRKGNKYLAVSSNGEIDVEKIKDMFNVVKEAFLTPVFSDNDRELKSISYSNLKDIIEKGDISSIVEDIYSSEFPLSGILQVSENSISLVTSKGFNGLTVKYSADGYFRAFNKNYSGQWAFYSDSLSPLKDSIKQANVLASIDGETKVYDGKYDVVLSPLVVGNLMSDFSYFASAFSVYTGSSFLYNVKQGDKIASEKLSIYDVPNKLGTREFDDEATFTYDKPLIENGIFQTLLYNNELAKLMNAKSTGNAGIISPISFGIEVKGGNVKFDSLLSGNVIFINNNWYTRYQNYLEGAFSTVCRDAVIVYKDGKPIGNAGRIRISDYIPRILKNIEEVSKESFPVKWWDAPLPTISPFILVKNVNITRA
ncbi:metallopeptidase TldD-related protein [Sulfurisphaera ohwakuensis]|uniref:metallopeptidase TldD-related protein n=1 Tax=Sulfurisphaera ohwakuensis TaxID=69656 RepID=UPI0036F41976